MSGQTSVFLFGHSFPAGLLRQAMEQHIEPKTLVELSNRFTIFVEGHQGLTYSRSFCNLSHYLSLLKSKVFDILIIDLGTNDLCDPNNPAEVVLQNVTKFLDHLKVNDISPQKIVFMSVIRRSAISRPAPHSIIGQKGSIGCSLVN